MYHVLVLRKCTARIDRVRITQLNSQFPAITGNSSARRRAFVWTVVASATARQTAATARTRLDATRAIRAEVIEVTLNKYVHANVKIFSLACPQFCPAIYAPICGSDGNTYSSECHLLKHNCNSGQQVEIAYGGECPTQPTYTESEVRTIPTTERNGRPAGACS